GLLIGSGYVVYRAITIPVPRDGGGIILFKIFGGILALLLFLYLLKGFFKFERAEKSTFVEIFEEEHPRLFAFIERLCEETGADLPARVYVSFEVNAAVVHDKGFINLFWPSKKNLLIGLGLVNVINLTEFKAVLAHEFGHFSQKSIKLNGYLYMSDRIVGDIVYGRDWFDRFLDVWKCVDIRLSFPAWIFSGVLWCLRKLLYGLYYAIFYLSQGLSRQREFNADLVAVSMTGSDAPVHTLCRSVFGDATLNQAIYDLQTAMDHHLYTRDMFYHQNHTVAFVRKTKKDPHFGEPPALPENPKKSSQVFEPDDDEIAQMWSTHPSNYDREQNAKDYYIRTAFDERSPWMLFDDVDELKERVTYKFYRVWFKVKKDVILAEPEEIQAFIDEERAEATFDPRYQGLYDFRDVDPGQPDDLVLDAQTSPWSIHQLSTMHQGLYNVEVKHRGQLHNKRLEEFNLIIAIQNGWHRPKNDEIDFRGKCYEVDDAKKLLKKVEKELKEDQEWFKDLDKQVFLCHYQMARHVDDELADELVHRYKFHMQVQKVWRDLKSQEASVGAALDFLNRAGSSQLQYEQFQEMLNIFRDARATLRQCLDAAKDMYVPALKNMTPGAPLAPFLLKEKLVRGLSDHEHSLQSKWIDKLLGQAREMQAKVNRIHFKSLGGILALQERIAAQCMEKWAALPQAPQS
ncbi:MAG: M48 family metalloprotease, partial [Gemmataceae bacterium]|nr:M48 family metalloprotease [Gemmataceae bacterium]